MADFDSTYIRAVQHPVLPYLLCLEAEFGAATPYIMPIGAGDEPDQCRAWFELKAGGEGLDVEWVPYGTPQADPIVAKALPPKHLGNDV